MAARKEVLEIAGLDVTIINPDKIYFPEAGHTKLDIVEYYLSVAAGVLRGVADRPMALKRYVNGIDGEAFYQKRAPENRPIWIETAELRYPSGRTADEIVVRDEAALAWVVNVGCIDLHPHPVRAGDLHHPDELRVDLDPVAGSSGEQVRTVALVVRDVLAGHGLVGWRRPPARAVPHLLPDRARLELPRRPPGGHGARPGGRGPGARPRHQPMVEGGAARRVHRLQPEREGPHDRVGVLGAADAGRPGVDPDVVG